jgi:lipoprotein-releasing system permease protein
VIGIAVTTAALVILIAAFNGIESMVEDLYSEFDSDIIIRSTKGKTFDVTTLNTKELQNIPGVESVCKAVEEIVVLRHEKKWVNAKMIGVEENYLQMANVQKHMVDGFPHLSEKNIPTALVGAMLLQKLGGYIPTNTGHETILCYFPKRDARVSVSSNPFRTQSITVAGRINYNKEVNDSYIVLPLDLAANMLGYDQDITSVYVSVQSNYELEKVKEKIQAKLGDGFEVKTHLEKNELIYKTSKSEKMIVIAILVFVFILAAFNLVASLTMLYIEKQKNIVTLKSFGANESFIFRIFFYEGLLIAFKGVIYGIIIGVVVCLAQLFGELLILPNSDNQPFPIELSVWDGLFVVVLVSTLSILASYFPVKYLVYKNREK